MKQNSKSTENGVSWFQGKTQKIQKTLQTLIIIIWFKETYNTEQHILSKACSDSFETEIFFQLLTYNQTDTTDILLSDCAIQNGSNNTQRHKFYDKFINPYPSN